MNILWVENNARFADVAGRTFLSAHDVTVVPSLEQARLHLTVHAFDIILLDYDLDDGKGTALVPDILAIRSPRPRLIAASSNARGNALLTAAGADAICSKLDFSKIASLIADVDR